MENNVSLGNSKLSASLRFAHAGLEREFQARYFQDNVGYIRAALVLAIVAWAFLAYFSVPPTGHESYLLIPWRASASRR